MFRYSRNYFYLCIIKLMQTLVLSVVLVHQFVQMRLLAFHKVYNLLLIKFIRRVVRLAFLCFMSEQLLLASSFLIAKFIMILINRGKSPVKVRGI